MKTKRIQQILSYVCNNGSSTYDELCTICEASLSTIRRDVDYLAKEGKIQKSRGGVMAIENSDVYINNIYQNSSFVQFYTDITKDKIAKKASELVNDGDIVYLGSGTTVAHMVKYLKDYNNITLITNNIYVVNEAMRNGCNIMLIGGLIDPNTHSAVGVQSIRSVKDLHANKAFMSANGISLAAGVTNSSELEADMKQAAISISIKSCLLIDQKKFNLMSLYTFANIADFDTIITDAEPERAYRELFEHNEQKLIIAY